LYAEKTLGDAYPLSWRVNIRCLDGQENLKQKRDCGYRAEPGYENAGVPVRGFPLALLAERLPALRQPLMVVFEPPATQGTVAATPRNRWTRPGE
jgi:hypothetical protein